MHLNSLWATKQNVQVSFASYGATHAPQCLPPGAKKEVLDANRALNPLVVQKSHHPSLAF
jgi:hypothetical protein